MSHTRRQRSRRAVLAGLALFVLSQFAAALVISCWGLGLRDPEFGYKVNRLKARLGQDQSRPLLAVGLGSSRTELGLRGLFAEPWLSERLGRPVVLFNMGIAGAGPPSNLVNLRRLLNEGIRPDLLLLEILPSCLREGHLIEEVQAFPARRLRHAEMCFLARLAGPDRPDLRREWWLGQAAALYTHRLSLVDGVAPTLLHADERWCVEFASEIDDSGWLGTPPLSPSQSRAALAHARATYEPALRDFRLSPRLLGVVEETVALARQAGLGVALVLMPEGPIFQSWYPPAVRRQIDQALQTLSREVDVPLLDLRDCVPESGFSDSHHLYPQGATRFTRRLAERIEPLLRQDEKR
jgi:hypothetical protein